MTKNSRYFRNNPNNTAVIIFVHGVFGDSISTWRNSNNTYWPELLIKDPDFDKANIYLVEYPSPLIGQSYSIDELADYMRRNLESDKVLNHSKLIFLSHSMGGAVTRTFLLRYREYENKVSFLYFFATPTSGSSMASLAHIVSKNPQLGSLIPLKSDKYLADIQRSWLASMGMTKIPSYCAYEMTDTYGFRIVDLQSAIALCNRRPDPIYKNHIDIVKPADNKDDAYRAFKSAYLDSSKTHQVNNEIPQYTPMKAIPDVSQAVRTTIINSLNQFKSTTGLVDVSKIVPGYFELIAYPSSGLYSYPYAYTQNSFNTHYLASVRIAGMEGSHVLELQGRGVWFAIDASTKYYFIYESEENWTTWRELKVERHPSINTLMIYQNGRIVEAYLNGHYVATFTKLKKAEPGPIGVGFKANPQSGGRINFQKLSVWELPN